MHVQLAEPGGTPPGYGEVQVDRCCSTECKSWPIDANGAAVIEVCPDASRDVVLTISTNPERYTYAPPRPVRACAASERVLITLQPHPGKARG